MSLRVWLPLNGNFNNQGLDGFLNFTTTGTVSDAEGKIGQSKLFSSSNIIAPYDFTLGNEASICLWVYYTAFPSSSSNDWIIHLGSQSGYANAVLGLSTYHTNYLTVMAGGKNDASYVHGFSLNTWYHIAYTWNTTTAKLYINGTLVKTYTNLTGGTVLTGDKISLGSNVVNSSTKLNGRLNDVRVYDHCLSPKEVEEISKGLVLHYKLDQNLNVLNNCYNYPTFDTSASAGGWNHWGNSGHQGSYGQNTDKTYIFRKYNTYSHWVANGDSATYNYLCYQSPSFSGGIRSVQAIIKEENSLPITNEIVYPAWNARNGGVPNHFWTSIKSLGDGFYLCKCEGISQDGSNNLIGFYVRAGYKIYISEAYCENDREICSDIFNQDNLTTIYDSSGYSNNGTIVGTLTAAANTARYQTTTYISSGDANYIQTPTIGLPGDKITLNFWFKSSNQAPGSNYHMPLAAAASSNQAYEMSIYKTGYLRGGLVVAGTRKVDNCTSTNLTDGNWHMCTMTYDGTIIKRYVDTIMEKSTTVSGSLITSTYFSIGHYGSNTSYCVKEAYISDIRIYTTALDENAIKELYNTAMTVDSLGNIYARELVEL